VSEEQLTVVEEAGVWRLHGSAAGEVGLVNEFLGYLADRNFSPRTCRAYAYDLLALTRWLVAEDIALVDVDVEVMLRFLTACREATPRGRPGGNVYSIRDGRNTGYAPATINRRLAAISSLFAFREMREPGSHSPMPPGPSRANASQRRKVRSAGACGQAEASLETAGSRAATAATRPVPRGVVGAVGQLPHMA
jgi:Phage integrase, N-terminal SAM-like domain